MPSDRTILRPRAGVFTALLLLAAAPVAYGAGPDPSNLVSQSVSYLRNLLGAERRPLVVVDHQTSIAAERVALRFTLADLGGARTPRTLDLALADGDILLDDRPIGHYEPGGSFQASWQELIYEASRRETADLVELVHEWEPAGVAGEEAEAADRIHARLAVLTASPRRTPAPRQVPQAGPQGPTINLDNLANPAQLEARLRALNLDPGQVQVTVPGGQVRLGDFTIGSGERIPGHLLVLRGDAQVYGILEGNLVALDGSIVVHPGGVVRGDVLTIGGMVQDAGGDILGEIRTLAPAERSGAPPAPAQPAGGLTLVLRNGAGLIGVFLTLVALGFGLVLFGRQNLEVVADTITHSFGRAFIVGLLAEMLLLPTFGMLVVGLLLSVVGVLLIPFAVLAYLLLLFIGVVGGYLAAAHAVGENYTRRQMAMGRTIASPNAYRFVVTGLLLMLGLWAAWVLFGWVPFAGFLMKSAAIVVTWLLVTAGFGATLLSRAGVREAFTGRIIPPEALTDEYLWATPQFGVPAAKRPARPLRDR